MTIAAVVPVWNGRALVARLLDTLAAQTRPAGEWIVVDNGSSDGAPELARDHGARVIAMGRNAGFATAVNRGIEAARAEWIAVLNSDVELAPDYFEKLQQAVLANDPVGSGHALPAPEPYRISPPGFATGKILDARRNGLIDATFDLTTRAATTWRAGSGKPDAPPYALPRAIFSAPWTAVLFRAEIFRTVGLLDVRFESYLEDVDFGLRCAVRGIGGLYVPEALAWHRGSASLGRWHPATVRHIARNQLFLAARHFPARLWWPVLVGQMLWGGLALRHGAPLSWLRGVAEGLSAFPAMRRSAKLVPGLTEQLRENERLLRGLQNAAGADAYWKLYFNLTRSGAK